MFALIITVCTSAMMDECTLYSLGRLPTEQQCHAVESIHRDVLGPEHNYRLECQAVKEEADEN
jgi:hypothetical protein